MRGLVVGAVLALLVPLAVHSQKGRGPRIGEVIGLVPGVRVSIYFRGKGFAILDSGNEQRSEFVRAMVDLSEFRSVDWTSGKEVPCTRDAGRSPER